MSETPPAIVTAILSVNFITLVSCLLAMNTSAVALLSAARTIPSLQIIPTVTVPVLVIVNLHNISDYDPSTSWVSIKLSIAFFYFARSEAKIP